MRYFAQHPATHKLKRSSTLHSLKITEIRMVTTMQQVFRPDTVTPSGTLIFILFHGRGVAIWTIRTRRLATCWKTGQKWRCERGDRSRTHPVRICVGVDRTLRRVVFVAARQRFGRDSSRHMSTQAIGNSLRPLTFRTGEKQDTQALFQPGYGHTPRSFRTSVGKTRGVCSLPRNLNRLLHDIA